MWQMPFHPLTKKIGGKAKSVQWTKNRGGEKNSNEKGTAKTVIGRVRTKGGETNGKMAHERNQTEKAQKKKVQIQTLSGRKPG